MKAAEVQEQIDTFKGKLEKFENQLTTLRKEILERQTKAGAALFEGKDTSRLEDEISKLESKCKTIDFAKATAQTKLSEAIAELKTAKKIDSQERIKEIRTEVDQAVNDLEEILKKALTSAQVFEGLLAEAWNINRTAEVPLSPLGTWANHSTSYDGTFHTDCILDGLLKRLSQYKPKGE